MQFYGLYIDTPLSVVHNTDAWQGSQIQQLHAKTNGAVYIHELERSVAQAVAEASGYAWRITDARFQNEDDMMTRFRAFDLKGNFVAATFGVSYDNAKSIRGGFKYPPATNKFYVPVEPHFTTTNTGGYMAQVLDYDHPSEGLSFGIYKQGKISHQALLITWRLFPIYADYPNSY